MSSDMEALVGPRIVWLLSAFQIDWGALHHFPSKTATFILYLLASPAPSM
jgi:hypothetical protein